MALNKLTDLHNHLFAQLERLSDEELLGKKLEEEIGRAKAIHGISKNIIDNAKVTLEATKFSYNNITGSKKLPEQF